MIKKEDIARKIVYWYKTAKKNFKIGYNEIAYIDIGRGHAYIDIAKKLNLITHDESMLLKTAFNRLW